MSAAHAFEPDASYPLGESRRVLGPDRFLVELEATSPLVPGAARAHVEASTLENP